MDVFPADDATLEALATRDRRDVAEPLAAPGVQALVDDVARAAGTPSDLPTALAALCRGVARLADAASADIWLHDRHAHVLICAASSLAMAPRYPAVPTIDQAAALARALRRDHVQLERLGAVSDDRDVALGLTVPLRGRRRALGVLVVRGLERPDAGVACDRVAGIGKQLSSILENAQLLDEVVRLAEERAELERRLRQSEKLLALGQFVAGLAHELNNPLQGVLGHLELAQRSRGLSAALRRDLRLIHREADRAARIVSDLLVFAGSGQLRRRPVAVNGVIRRVLRLRGAALRRMRIDLDRNLADGLPAVDGDPLLLRQALMNLVVNAEQAMAGPGRLFVSSRRTKGRVAVTIADTGPGLAPDARSRLFEPFFTTKDVGAGTGLGLAIAFGVAQAHGGSIEAGDRPGGGARFTLILPPAQVRHRTPKSGGRRPKAEGR